MSELHPYLEQAFEEIDSSVFSGDQFYDKDNLAFIDRYLARWTKELMSTGRIVKLMEHFGENEYRELKIGEKIVNGDMFFHEELYPAFIFEVYTEESLPHYRRVVGGIE